MFVNPLKSENLNRIEQQNSTLKLFEIILNVKIAEKAKKSFVLIRRFVFAFWILKKKAIIPVH